jgi:low temperature requirement protein LtrA
VVAFVGSAALWWIYFNRSAEDGRAVIARLADPGRLGRVAYTYFHLPMVAGTDEQISPPCNLCSVCPRPCGR